MKTLTILLIFAMSIAEASFEKASNPLVFSTTSSTMTNEMISQKPHKYHPLPPVAMPGIVNDFQPLNKRGGNRMLLSELRFLKNQYFPMEQNLHRIRRSSFHPKPISQIPLFINRSNQRDLRRLRRDLGYDSTPDFSSHQSLYQPEINQPSVHYGRSSHRPKALGGKDLDRLLERLFFMEPFASMTQEADPSVSSGGQQMRIQHATQSRFAPQPKLFMEDIFDQRPARVQEQRNAQVQPEDLLWIPEKRWPKPRASLSMIPGFKKRSLFREAAKQQMMNQRSKRQKNISSLGTFLGTENGPAIDMVRRIAM